ncbi:FAS1-like dehydratase domain-containing protein [Nocardiopsis oceani]
MSGTTYVTDEMSSAEGREIERVTSFPVSESDIRRWAVAVYYPGEPSRLFWDGEYAGKTVHGGIVAPEEFNPFAWMVAERRTVGDEVDSNDPDALEKRLGLPALGLGNQLNGGMAVEYGVRIRPGDVITSVTRMGRYWEKSGRLGVMLFSVTQDVWTNQRQERVKATQQTLIRY